LKAVLHCGTAFRFYKEWSILIINPHSAGEPALKGLNLLTQGEAL
jgi:hypothetical protein